MQHALFDLSLMITTKDKVVMDSDSIYWEEINMKSVAVVMWEDFSQKIKCSFVIQ